MKAYRIILFFLFGSAFLVSQEQRQIDSVKNAIPSLKSDTSRIRAYLTLAEWLSDLDEWSGYNNKALELINKLYDGASGPEKELLKKQKANALNNLGLYYKEKNLYDPALENYEKSLVLNRELKNTEGGCSNACKYCSY